MVIFSPHNRNFLTLNEYYLYLQNQILVQNLFYIFFLTFTILQWHDYVWLFFRDTDTAKIRRQCLVFLKNKQKNEKITLILARIYAEKIKLRLWSLLEIMEKILKRSSMFFDYDFGFSFLLFSSILIKAEENE